MKEKLQSELLAARKAKDKKKAELIKVILGEMERSPTKSADAVKIVMKLIEAAKGFPTPDTEEIQILETFLPQFVSRDTIVAFSKYSTAQTIGELMNLVKSYAKENSLAVDGKLVKEVFDAFKTEKVVE